MKNIAGNAQAGYMEHPELTPCPCGAEAVWYRVVLWPDLSTGPGQPVGALVANDFYDDLCDGCFEAMVAVGGEENRAGWIASMAVEATLEGSI